MRMFFFSSSYCSFRGKPALRSTFSHSHISEAEIRASSIKQAGKSKVLVEEDPTLELVFLEEFLRITSLGSNVYP